MLIDCVPHHGLIYNNTHTRNNILDSKMLKASKADCDQQHMCPPTAQLKLTLVALSTCTPISSSTRAAFR
eukprot:1139978-Pelagomonas_calceolata.AAC.3